MDFKVALLLLLALTSTATATATIIVPTMSSRAMFHVSEGTMPIADSLMEPLGDPIDDPAFPH